MKKRHIISGAGALAAAVIASKLLSQPRDVAWSDHRADLPHADRSRFVSVNGVRMHYQEAGEPSAPAVLLVHGFCASTFVWSDVFLPLAQSGFRVIAPDLMGFGFSDKPARWEYTIEGQARLIVGLMDTLDIKRADLVGSSYGGAIAAMCALDFPERVRRLVLVDAVTNDEAIALPILRVAASPVVGDIASRLVLGSRRIVRWRLRMMFRNKPHLVDEERLRNHHLPLLASKTQAAAIRTLRKWKAIRIERNAHLIEQPTLLVWGENDWEIPLRCGKTMHQAMQRSRLVVFKQCGHVPQMEYPEQFTRLVTDFLRADAPGCSQ